MPRTIREQASHEAQPGAADWRAQRRQGIAVIALSALVAAGLWLAIRYGAPPCRGWIRSKPG